MAFNGCCTGNDMAYSSEGSKSLVLKLNSPKPSYEIISQKKMKNTIQKVDYKLSKEIFFNQENIPKWLDISLYSIPKKDNKAIIALHIINKCLTSKNPILNEPNLIFYSHENETDLIRLIPFLIDISIQMKCDIVSFDYLGFGCSSGKPKINTIMLDGEDALNFAISYLNYKIENIILLGKGIGSMSSIYLASRFNFRNCKGLILYMPTIGKKIIDIKVMRSIFCQTLLIMEFENKKEINNNEIVNLCREIPNEKEWFPIRKKSIENKNKFSWFKNEYDDDDVYFRHRKNFIIKLIDYVYPDKEIIKRKKESSSIIGGSTGPESISGSNSNSSNAIAEQENLLSLRNKIVNKKNLDLNFGEKTNEKTTIKIYENISKNNTKSFINYENTEIEINNDEDY